MLSALLSGIGLAAPAGLNAYIPLLVLALTDRFSSLVTLDQPYDFISSTWAIVVLLLLLTVELVADKIPGIDHANDLVQTAIRPVAGSFLMMATSSSSEGGDVNSVLSLVIGLLVAGTVHGVKTSVRPAVTVTTGGVGNPIVSFVEDAVAAVTAVIAILVPLLLLLLIPLFALLLWRIYDRLRHSGRAFRRFSGQP